MPPTKYIIVTGGVLSGLGKGVATASIGAVLKMMHSSIRITIKKLDPYLNVDPGTMNPREHGEVFVTHDGTETDLDVGYYERFTGIRADARNSTSSGKLFQKLIARERRGDFLGKTVQMIPHFTDEMKSFIRQDEDQYDVILCEIGGSVGDIEAMAFYEALRQLKMDVGTQQFTLVHLTYLVHYKASDELKTKPAQNSIRTLMQTGLPPDILLCRTENPMDELPDAVIRKLRPYCARLIWAPNLTSIYNIPLQFIRQGLHTHLSQLLQLPAVAVPDVSKWARFENQLSARTSTCTIAIVGKYVELNDAYCSLLDALCHASNRRIRFKWFDTLAPPDIPPFFVDVDAVLVPGGFGARGLNAMVDCLHYARVQKLPTLGICLGMQMMVIEFLRHRCDRPDAVSAEHEESSAKDEVIGLLSEWEENGKQHHVDHSTKGGSMRLGDFSIRVRVDSLLHDLYHGNTTIVERHRHRYEVCPKAVPIIEAGGMRVVAHRDGLVEAVEVPAHPFYVGCQYHPEYRSSPFAPHPVFVGFLNAIPQTVSTARFHLG